ncbi:MAG: DUF4129 domain-containing protein [Betaproteobacteria bacterium]
MELERIAVQLRRRTAWEALDLGHAMLRAWAGPAYRVWLAFYWPLGLLMLGVLSQWPTVAFFVFWWFKPVFDRILLFTFSRALFGHTATVGEVWRALPGILRGPGLLSALTVRRFSMARSFNLPVWQLEGQSGAAARSRFRVLGRRTSGHAIWLTFVGANLVTILGISLVMLVEFMAPVGTNGLFSWAEWASDDVVPWKIFIVNVLWLVAETLVEPLYVASGFALYLNRRSDLEGWDIDIAFRRLAARQTAARSASLVGLVVAFLFAGFLFVAPPPASAAEAAPAPGTPRQVIAEVLADPVFGRDTEEMRWVLKDKPGKEKKKDSAGPESGWMKGFLRFIEFIGEIMRGVVWIVAALLVAGLIYLLIRYREHWLPQRRERQAPPEFLFGLDVRPESLPDDVAAAAQAALAAGRIEEALSLLYRGALVALLHRLEVEFRAGDTENDCLARVDRRLDAEANGYFRQLLDAWRMVAYGRQHPSLPALQALCTGWGRYFGLSGGAR